MKQKFMILLVAAFSFQVVQAAPPAEEGKSIFAARCASCHSVNKVLTGPALAGVHDRRSIDWIISFVHSSQSMVKSGDKDAVALFEQFNKIPMPDHADLSGDQIKSIVEYIKGESVTAGSEKPPFAKMTKIRPAYVPFSLSKDYSFFLGFLMVVGLLVMSLLFAVQLKQYQRLQAAKE